MLIADNVGINVEPVAAFDLNGAFITRSVAVPNQPTSVTLVAATTVNISSLLTLAQTTAGVNITVPTPSGAILGRRLTIYNNGTVTAIVNTNNVGAGRVVEFIWNGTFWASVGISYFGTLHTREFNSNLTSNGTSMAFDISPAGFSSISSVQATAYLPGGALTTAPLCSIVALSTASITVMILESNGGSEGLELSTTNKTVYLTVKGN